MTVFRILIAVVVTGCLCCGCTLKRDAAHAAPFLKTASSRRAPQDPQTAFRVELLRNQLRQSRIDLQSASAGEERQSIQERIDIIQNQLDSISR